jgi:preprotein translocase subunit SecE
MKETWNSIMVAAMVLVGSLAVIWIANQVFHLG